MNTKAKGSRNERRSRDLFRQQGYSVTKAGASLGEWDLICIGPTDFILCQVKTNQWPSKEETQREIDFICPQNVKKIVHRWRDRQENPDIKEIK